MNKKAIVAIIVAVVIVGGYLLIRPLMMPEKAVANTPTEKTAAANTYTGKRVLCINSYHEGYEWSDGIERGIHSVLDGTGVE